MIDWFERDDVLNIIGHVGERLEDSGQWESFRFSITDTEGDDHQITLNKDDLPDGFDWEDLFDYLEYLSDEYEVDYVNPYSGE